MRYMFFYSFPPTWGYGGGNTTSSSLNLINITPPKPDKIDKIIIDSTTVTDCVKSIIDKLKVKDNHYSVVPSITDQPVSHISQAILDLFDSSIKYNLNFSIEQLGTDANGNQINGLTTKLAPYFTSWSIKLDSDLTSNGTQLFIAKTIIHESMHAIIGYTLKEKISSNLVISIQDLYKKNGNDQNLTEHEFMSQFVESFAFSLAAWDNHQQTMDYYRKLSWGGLETSSAYKKLTNQTEIQNIIKNERFGKKMRKELNVIKFLKLFLIFLVFTNCNVLKADYYKTETYEIKREKSKYWTKPTQLNVIAYEHKDKTELIPVFSTTINNIITHSNYMDSIPNTLVRIIPSNYDIEISFIGKETINIKNLLVKDGDSIVIKAYMKENLTPLY